MEDSKKKNTDPLGGHRPGISLEGHRAYTSNFSDVKSGEMGSRRKYYPWKNLTGKSLVRWRQIKSGSSEQETLLSIEKSRTGSKEH